jgi:MtN3 and saliva related transmembrane protein
MLTLILGILATSFSTLAFIPQLVKIIKTKETKDLSLVSFSVLALGALCWLLYGISIRQWPVIVTNGTILIFLIFIVAMKLIYK